MSDPSLRQLMWRYLTFVWMFDVVPVRADALQRAALVRGNRDRGIRFLPVYLRRYLHMFFALVVAGTASEAMASPVVTGAFFTLSTVVLVALLTAGVGFAAMRLRAFDHGRY